MKLPNDVFLRMSPIINQHNCINKEKKNTYINVIIIIIIISIYQGLSMWLHCLCKFLPNPDNTL